MHVQNHKVQTYNLIYNCVALILAMCVPKIWKPSIIELQDDCLLGCYAMLCHTISCNFSGTSAHFHRTTQCNIPEDNTPHSLCFQNLKSHIIQLHQYVTTRNWALLEMLVVTQTVKKFLTFYGTQRFITLFTRACHWSLSWTRSIQSSPDHPTLSL
jgi:hypothetical protein